MTTSWAFDEPPLIGEKIFKKKKKRKHTRDTISEEKEQWGVCEFPVWEDCLRFVVPISTAEIECLAQMSRLGQPLVLT